MLSFKYSVGTLPHCHMSLLTFLNKCKVIFCVMWDGDIQWVRAGHLLPQSSSGAPWCQCNQPGSVILRHSCAHTGTHTHTPPPEQGWANDSSLCPPFSLCLSVPLYSSVSVCTGDITQKGYEKKRGKLLAPYIPQIQGKTHRPAVKFTVQQQQLLSVLRLPVILAVGVL